MIVKKSTAFGEYAEGFSFCEIFFKNLIDKRTYVLYNDICDFVALCGKATKTEYRCHILRALCPTTPAVS